MKIVHNIILVLPSSSQLRRIPSKVLPSSSSSSLNHIPKVLILLIAQILKSMNHPLLHNPQRIPFLILPTQMPSQNNQVQNQKRVATEMCRESDQISGTVPPEEDLGSDGVSCGPGDEIHGYCYGFLGLAGDLYMRCVSECHTVYLESMGKNEHSDLAYSFPDSGQPRRRGRCSRRKAAPRKWKWTYFRLS